MSELEDLNELKQILSTAQSENKLTTSGKAKLDAINSGPLASPTISNILQGLTFNQSDEIGAWLRSNLGDVDYDTAVQIERAGLEESKSESPISSTLEQIIGSAVPLAVTKRPQSFLGNIPQGAAIGGAYAFGDSKGNIQERLPDTAMGAASGAVVQPLVAGALRPIENLFEGTGKFLKGPARLGTQQARALLKEAIENDAGGEEFANLNEAFLYVLNKNTTGKPYTIADLGPNSQALLDVVNLLPGQSKRVARNFLRKRDSGILTRLKGDLTDAFGQRADYFEEYKALETARKELGDKLYTRAYRKNIKINSDLLELFKRPSMSTAFNNAFNIANEEGENIGKYAFTKNGLTLNGKKATNISTKFMHYLKRGLDDAVYNSKSPISGTGKDLLNASKGTRIAFLNILDDENPAYKLARNYWSGKSSVLDSMKLGREFLKADSNELAEEISSMSGSELEAFRLGSMQGILSEIESGAERTAMSRLLKSPERQKLLKLTFPQTDIGKAAASKFINNLETEVVMRETSKFTLGGSPTILRGEALRKVRDLSRRDPVSGLTDLIGKAIAKDFKTVADKQETAVANELARMLTETAPDKLNVIEKELSQKGIKQVLSKYAPGLLPNLTKMIVNPRTITGQVGTSSTDLDAQKIVDQFMQ
ncbi:hypothetical protein N9S98_00295 [Alphaproteobacteria bacterium]|nr:hypothetical protein [Alphaproteobacteria bacterium]